MIITTLRTLPIQNQLVTLLERKMNDDYIILYYDRCKHF